MSGSLSLPSQLQTVPLQPVGAPASTLGLVELVSLAKTTRALAGGSQAAQLPVLLHRRAHPVDLGVAGDGGVVDVDHDHLVVPGEETLVQVTLNNKANVAFSLVGRILANPVRVQNPESLESTSNLEETVARLQY